MSAGSDQYLRKVSLIVAIAPDPDLVGPPQESNEPGIDLSEFRIRFQVVAADVQSPNNASIRIYNLSDSTIIKVKKEYNRVILQAGYEDGAFGVIFDGMIKQFRVGRESATTTYLDILAADGDLEYNFGVVSSTITAGSTPKQRIEECIKQMGLGLGYTPTAELDSTGGILPRGKVLFGMGRNVMRTEARSRGTTWSIQNGKVVILPLNGYLVNKEVVILNTMTGLIGMPEQTDQGIKVRCLLNPKLAIGGLIQLDNKSINQTIKQNPDAAPLPYNQYTSIQLLARTTEDGYYRLYVVEHIGDTRGNEWYSELTSLAFDISSKTCTADY